MAASFNALPVVVKKVAITVVDEFATKIAAHDRHQFPVVFADLVERIGKLCVRHACGSLDVEVVGYF